MLGGIGESTALKLLHEKRVQHYFIRGAYLIPKKYVVDYVLSTFRNFGQCSVELEKAPR